VPVPVVCVGQVRVVVVVDVSVVVRQHGVPVVVGVPGAEQQGGRRGLPPDEPPYRFLTIYAPSRQARKRVPFTM
jgi:hypothetical protein